MPEKTRLNRLCVHGSAPRRHLRRSTRVVSSMPYIQQCSRIHSPPHRPGHVKLSTSGRGQVSAGNSPWRGAGGADRRHSPKLSFDFIGTRGCERNVSAAVKEIPGIFFFASIVRPQLSSPASWNCNRHEYHADRCRRGNRRAEEEVIEKDQVVFLSKDAHAIK